MTDRQATIDALPEMVREVLRETVTQASAEGMVRGYRAGAEAAVETMLRVAAEWRGLPEGKAAVQRFADMVARAVREAAVTVTEEKR
jgi:hypothetical protein